jgi:hypothetical protein
MLAVNETEHEQDRKLKMSSQHGLRRKNQAARTLGVPVAESAATTYSAAVNQLWVSDPADESRAFASAG